MMRLRMATAQDAAAIATIYHPYVAQTAITFEYEPPDTTAFCQRMAAIQGQLPWLVAEQAGQVIGYGYASPFHPRAAYAWSCELSIYLEQATRGQGVGRALYQALLQLLKAQGYRMAYALITHPNEASEAFHRAMGFAPCGCLHTAGSKHGTWWDVAYWEYLLAEIPPDAAPPLPISQLSSAQVSKILHTFSIDSTEN